MNVQVQRNEFHGQIPQSRLPAHQLKTPGTDFSGLKISAICLKLYRQAILQKNKLEVILI